MDWPMESDGIAVQQAWSQSIANLLGWWVLAWAIVVTGLLLLTLLATPGFLIYAAGRAIWSSTCCEAIRT